MTDQKLVDELEKALTDEAYDGGMGVLSGEEFSDLVRTLAVTAAEVVAEAHTPTDDERGDLIGAASAAFKARGGAPDWEEDAIARDLIIRWHLRGFEDGEKYGRRTEVPEPSAWACCRHCLRGDGTRVADCMGDEDSHTSACRHGCNAATESEGKPSDLVRRLVELRGNMRHNADEVATLDIAITAVSAQGEPSDAQVLAGLNAFYVPDSSQPETLSEWGEGAARAMRSALRAAGGVR